MIWLQVVRDWRLARLAVISLIAIGLGVLGSWTDPGDPALAPRGPDDAVTIWVADNGFHTDLILPRDRLGGPSGPLAQAVETLGPGDWVAVGWGDARFYPDTRPISDRLPDGARAFLRPGNPSVVLLDPLDQSPERLYRPGTLHPMRLSEAGLEGLRRRLESSLVVRQGAPVPGPASQIGDGRFFRSVETFWIGHLCNHWAGELLSASGQSIRPFRTIFSAEIVRIAHSASEMSGPPDPADETSGHDA